MKTGVLLDDRQVLPGFDYVFYEVKPASGRASQPLPGAWNVVDCFADNTMARKDPNLVATCRGDRARRGTPKKFLWDWICPSREEYREYCLAFIRKLAKEDIAGIRLDSVCFPREGYCDCETCIRSRKESQMTLTEWRVRQITSFVRQVRENIQCGLGLTLEPDPSRGRERFGLDMVQLSSYVDFIVTPLYMDYSIVYWLDILANCFRTKMHKPYFIELYAGHPRAPTKHLVSAMAVACEYADAVILSTFQASIAQSLQREMVTDPSIRKFFEERQCGKMLDVLKEWEKIL